MNTGHCHICDQDVPSVELLDHLRVMHPDAYGDGPDRWPDGQVVVIDASLEPHDFGGRP